jgi:hypothetical protein
VLLDAAVVVIDAACGVDFRLFTFVNVVLVIVVVNAAVAALKVLLLSLIQLWLLLLTLWLLLLSVLLLQLLPLLLVVRAKESHFPLLKLKVFLTVFILTVVLQHQISSDLKWR